MTREGFLTHAQSVYRGTRSVIRAVPPRLINHRPHPTMMTVGQLMRHLCSACGGSFKMVLEWVPPPGDTPHLEPTLDQLRDYQTPAEALSHLDRDEAALREAVMALSESDFQSRLVPLPWAPGVSLPLWEIGLSMAEHLTTHRAQLFTILRICGEPIDTGTLYGS